MLRLESLLVVFLAALCVVATVSAEEKVAKKSTVNCNQTEPQDFNIKGTDEVEIICQNNAKRELTLTINAADGSGLLIIVGENNFKTDEFKLYDNTGGNSSNVTLYDSAAAQHLVMLTGTKNFKLMLKTEAPISLKVKASCDVAGTFKSYRTPVIPDRPPKGASVVCKLSVTTPYKIDMDQFHLTGTSSMNVTGLSDGFNGVFDNKTKLDFPLIANSMQITFTLSLDDKEQLVNFTTVAYTGGKACGDMGPMIAMTKDKSVDITAPPGQVSDVRCFWLIKAAKEDTKLLTEATISKLKFGGDFVSVLDGGTAVSPAIMEMTSLNPNPDMAMTSGPYQTVYFTSQNFMDPSIGFSLNVKSIRNGGRYFNTSDISFSGDQGTSYNMLETSEENIIIFSLKDNLTNGNLTIYADFNTRGNPIATFVAKNETFDVYSPGHRMLVVANSVNKFTTKFQSESANDQCRATFTDLSRGRIVVNKKPTDSGTTCCWLFPPRSDRIDLIPTVSLNGAKKADISTFDGAHVTTTVEGDYPFTFIADFKRGLRVIFDGQNGTFEMSYLSRNETDLKLEATPSQNITLVSPLYPNAYPNGAVHNYKITGADKKIIGYYLAFERVDFANATELVITPSTGSSITVKRTYVPDDMILPAGDLNMNFHSPRLDVGVPIRTGSGFVAPVVPLACGGLHTNVSINATTEKYPASVSPETRCIWILSGNMSNDVNTGVGLNVTISMNGTESQSVNHSLRVYDGKSAMTSPLHPNWKLDKMFQSLTNTLIIVYEPAKDKLTAGVSIHMQTFECSVAAGNMCKASRICMQDGWKCDNIVQCSDGSDEIGCNSTCPTPPPTPTPTPSSGYKAAFWICVPLALALGALFTKFGPVMLKRFRDSRYQQFHDLGDH